MPSLMATSLRWRPHSARTKICPPGNQEPHPPGFLIMEMEETTKAVHPMSKEMYMKIDYLMKHDESIITPVSVQNSKL